MDKNITIEELKNDLNEVRIAILTYRGEADPVMKLNYAVVEYTKDQKYYEFIDMNMNNPWVRVIILGEV